MVLSKGKKVNARQANFQVPEKLLVNGTRNTIGSAKK